MDNTLKTMKNNMRGEEMTPLGTSLSFAMGAAVMVYKFAQPLNDYAADSKSILDYIALALTSGPAA